jgi:ATP-dependent DNA helicase RecQ
MAGQKGQSEGLYFRLYATFPNAIRASMPNRIKILREVFGYESFRPNQEEVVNAMIAGQHVLAVMPTGAGKSLCYQVPALARGGLAIVVSPLVALMQDQVAALKLAGVAAETINSSLDRDVNI